MKQFTIALITALVTTVVIVALAFTWLRFDIATLTNTVEELEAKVEAVEDITSTIPQRNQRFGPGGERGDGQQSGNTNVQQPNTKDSEQPTGGGDILQHEVYVTSSDNPDSFEDSDEVVFEKASVPEAVLLHTDSEAGDVGDLLMYFPSFEKFSGAGTENIAYSRSADNGETWTTRAIITMTGKENAGAPVDPSLVQLDDGTLRMYFFGSENVGAGAGGPAAQEGAHVIYSAVSSDGVNWEVEEGERIALEDITDPEVIQLDDTWIMYLSQGQKSLIATSTDGLNFELTESVWNGGGVPGAYVDADNIVHIYGCKQGISTATSTDGIIFEDSATAITSWGYAICDPSPVLLEDGTVLMVYKKVEVGNPNTPNTPNEVTPEVKGEDIPDAQTSA